MKRCGAIKTFVSATNVWTGKVRVFGQEELTPDVVMASACLPTVFQAVEIDGVPYWDGGFGGNPALFPFFYETETQDCLLVQINPIETGQDTTLGDRDPGPDERDHVQFSPAP